MSASTPSLCQSAPNLNCTNSGGKFRDTVRKSQGLAAIALAVLLGFSIVSISGGTADAAVSKPHVEFTHVGAAAGKWQASVGTASENNARSMAQDYLATSAFSRSGLIDQLKYEGFSTQDATSAVDSLNVDWNQQAAKMAKQYLDTSAFSRSGLIEQLEFEGFTQAQAEFGVSTTGL